MLEKHLQVKCFMFLFDTKVYRETFAGVFIRFQAALY